MYKPSGRDRATASADATSSNTGDIAPPTQDKSADKDRSIANVASTCWFSFASIGKSAATAAGRPRGNAHTEGKTGLDRRDHILVIDDTPKLGVDSFMLERMKQYLDNYPTFEQVIEDLLYNGCAGGGQR